MPHLEPRQQRRARLPSELTGELPQDGGAPPVPHPALRRIFRVQGGRTGDGAGALVVSLLVALLILPVSLPLFQCLHAASSIPVGISGASPALLPAPSLVSRDVCKRFLNLTPPVCKLILCLCRPRRNLLEESCLAIGA